MSLNPVIAAKMSAEELSDYFDTLRIQTLGVVPKQSEAKFEQLPQYEEVDLNELNLSPIFSKSHPLEEKVKSLEGEIKSLKNEVEALSLHIQSIAPTNQKDFYKTSLRMQQLIVKKLRRLEEMQREQMLSELSDC